MRGLCLAERQTLSFPGNRAMRLVPSLPSNVTPTANDQQPPARLSRKRQSIAQTLSFYKSSIGSAVLIFLSLLGLLASTFRRADTKNPLVRFYTRQSTTQIPAIPVHSALVSAPLLPSLCWPRRKKKRICRFSTQHLQPARSTHNRAASICLTVNGQRHRKTYHRRRSRTRRLPTSSS